MFEKMPSTYSHSLQSAIRFCLQATLAKVKPGHAPTQPMSSGSFGSSSWAAASWSADNAGAWTNQYWSQWATSSRDAANYGGSEYLVIPTPPAQALHMPHAGALEFLTMIDNRQATPTS